MRITLAVWIGYLFLLMGCGESKTYAEIETDYGSMKILLYDSTPKHKENFIKLVKEGFYNDLLFHRVINGFMIQGGDPDSKGAPQNVALGQGGPGYMIDEEIGALHIKGALAAARTPDAINPERKSSGSQFYIVQGSVQTDQTLDNWERQKGVKYSPEQRQLYKELGGTPQLDNDYTVFGEVVEGLDVIDKIAAAATAPGDRPVQDIKMRIRIL